MPVIVTPDRGRCYRADRDFRPGEIVFQEGALQAVLYDDQASGRCHHTFQEDAHLLR